MAEQKRQKKKILLLGNSHLTVFGFRGELIKRMIDDGNEVIVAFPNGPFGEGEKDSREYGCKFIEVSMNRRGTNPKEDLFLFIRYISIIKNNKPDIVLGYTVKCDVYGGLACRLLGIPFMPNITGIGKGLAEGGAIKSITTLLYKLAILKAQCVFFQNEADRQFFIDNGIRFRKSVLLPGSGVNIEKYRPIAYPKDDKIIFTYIARIMKAKGIDQYLEAAKQIKKKYDCVEFHVCGYCEEDYLEAISEAESKGYIIYHGLVDDVLPYEEMSHCIVLPTFHPEGMSNVLLEAAACARPIITTDRPGCREVVDDGITGFLVKERDSQDLVKKIEKFIALKNTDRETMGIQAREKIVNEFDRKIVVEAYMGEIRCFV